MTFTVLATNGGPHPPDKWAALSADKIAGLIHIDEQSNSDEAAAARKAKPRFAIAIADALDSVFSNVMAAERSHVESGSVKTRHDPFEIDKFIDEAATATSKASVGTPFEKHFYTGAASGIVRIILRQNLIDAANIQRSWAFDAKGL